MPGFIDHQAGGRQPNPNPGNDGQPGVDPGEHQQKVATEHPCEKHTRPSVDEGTEGFGQVLEVIAVGYCGDQVGRHSAEARSRPVGPVSGLFGVVPHLFRGGSVILNIPLPQPLARKLGAEGDAGNHEKKDDGGEVGEYFLEIHGGQTYKKSTSTS